MFAAAATFKAGEDVPATYTGFAEKLGVTPAGAPETLKVTLPAKPFSATIVRGYDVDCPTVTDRWAVAADNENEDVADAQLRRVL